MTTYTLKELSKASGETRFTIRHAIRTGFLRCADGAGSHRHFTESHLHTLLAIRALRQGGFKHDALRQRLRDATDAEIRRLAGVKDPPAPVVAQPPAVAPPPPAPARDAGDLRRAVQSVVIVAADTLDVAPKHAKAVVVAVLERMLAEEMGATEALEVLRE